MKAMDLDYILNKTPDGNSSGLGDKGSGSEGNSSGSGGSSDPGNNNKPRPEVNNSERDELLERVRGQYSQNIVREDRGNHVYSTDYPQDLWLNRLLRQELATRVRQANDASYRLETSRYRIYEGEYLVKRGNGFACPSQNLIRLLQQNR